MNEEQELDIIDPRAVVSVKMSTGFYQRMQELLKFHIKDKTQQELTIGYSQIKEQKIIEPWVEHMQSIFILLKEFQMEAHAAGKVNKMTKKEAEDYVKKNFPGEEATLKIVDENNQEKEISED